MMYSLYHERRDRPVRKTAIDSPAWDTKGDAISARTRVVRGPELVSVSGTSH